MKLGLDTFGGNGGSLGAYLDHLMVPPGELISRGMLYLPGGGASLYWNEYVGYERVEREWSYVGSASRPTLGDLEAKEALSWGEAGSSAG